MATGDNIAPIIIKKVRKSGGHGHHGGAWKVAYADFVTAMMAFFLLLWLLASTSEEQREGIADYFTPTVVSQSTTSGSGGILGGETVTAEGSARDSRTPLGVIVTPQGEGRQGEEGKAPRQATGQADGEASGEVETADGARPGVRVEAAEGRAQTADEEAAERAEFAQITDQLRNAIARVPELNALAENLLVDQTPEGLRIQLVDRQNTSMFASGSALPLAHTRTLLTLIADAVDDLPNRLAIKGHTDATPFRGEGNYTNWELSSDRAHASRRALRAAGLPESRVAYVVGKADREPLDTADPFAPVNRRISIVLLRDGLGEAAAEAGAPQPVGPVEFEPPSILDTGPPRPRAAATPPAATTTTDAAAGGGTGVVVEAGEDPFSNVLTFPQREPARP